MRDNEEQRLGILPFLQERLEAVYGAHPLPEAVEAQLDLNRARCDSPRWGRASSGRTAIRLQTRARYQLGLVTPNSEKCRILVDGVERISRDGQVFMFDETSTHSAENATDVNRIILFRDVERPKKYGLMTAINRWVSHHIVKASATNVDGKRAGC